MAEQGWAELYARLIQIETKLDRLVERQPADFHGVIVVEPATESLERGEGVQ